ncbi:MAG: type 4a pilus biogenesis protein PilO [Nitrospirota bacterium]
MKKKLYIVAIAILILSLFIYEYYFVMPQSESIRGSIVSKYETLQKYEKFINEVGTTEDVIKKAIEDTDNIEAGLIKEGSKFLASARLQRKVEDLAEKAELKIMSIRPLNVVKYDTYTGIPLYLDGSGDIKQLSEFLRLIESDKMLIKIDKINVSVVNIQNPKDLRVRIQISGLSRA